MKSIDIKLTKNNITTFPNDYEEKIKNKIKLHNLKFIEFDIITSSEWNGRYTKVKLKCKNHGIISMSISSLLRGSGCNKCGIIKMKDKQRKTKNEFITQIKNIHDNLSFDEVEYINDHTKVTVKCNIHNYYFDISPTHLIQGRNCKKCKNDKLKLINSSDNLKFIESCKKIHGDYFSFDKLNYINNKTNILLYCNKHKDYILCNPNRILSGGGCKICSTHGYNTSKAGCFYIQKLKSSENEVYYKFGITNKSALRRMKNIIKNSIFEHTIFLEEYFDDGNIPFLIEQEIKNNCVCKVINKESLNDGYTETVNKSELSKILEIVEKYKRMLTNGK